MARGVVPIRLDAGVERPEERTGFKHQLPAWAYEHRVELVLACLSLIRAWVEAGRPQGKAVLGRFESWAAIMSGILDHIGLPGFLANRRELVGQADKETREWTAVCPVWWETYKDSPITAGHLFELVKERKLLLDVWGGRTQLGAVQRIGHALAKRRDRIYGKYAIRSAGLDGVTRNASYRLEALAGGQQKTPESPETSASTQQAQARQWFEPRDCRGCFPGDLPAFSQDTSKKPAKHPAAPNGAKPHGNGVSRPAASVLGVSGVWESPSAAESLEVGEL